MIIRLGDEDEDENGRDEKDEKDEGVREGDLNKILKWKSDEQHVELRKS